MTHQVFKYFILSIAVMATSSAYAQQTKPSTSSKHAKESTYGKHGKTTLQALTFKDTCPKHAVRQAQRRLLNHFNACYENRLVLNPHLQGDATLRWSVSTKGKVYDVSISGNTVQDDKVSVCIKRSVKLQRFPKQKSECTVTQALSFKPLKRRKQRRIKSTCSSSEHSKSTQ